MPDSGSWDHQTNLSVSISAVVYLARQSGGLKEDVKMIWQARNQSDMQENLNSTGKLRVKAWIRKKVSKIIMGIFV